jgi:hypothetical protein
LGERVVALSSLKEAPMEPLLFPMDPSVGTHKVSEEEGLLWIPPVGTYKVSEEEAYMANGGKL